MITNERISGGSLLLAGRSGIGRKDVVQLIANMHTMPIFSPKITPTYQQKQFDNDIKTVSTFPNLGAWKVWVIMAHHCSFRPSKQPSPTRSMSFSLSKSINWLSHHSCSQSTVCYHREKCQVSAFQVVQNVRKIGCNRMIRYVSQSVFDAEQQVVNDISGLNDIQIIIYFMLI